MPEDARFLFEVAGESGPITLQRTDRKWHTVRLALRPSAGAKASRPGIVTVETMLLGVPPVQILKSLGGQS